MPCVRKMAERVDDRPGTGCRADCLHRRYVEGYRERRALDQEARKLAREAAGAIFPAEAAAWEAAHPAVVLFKSDLIDHQTREEPAA